MKKLLCTLTLAACASTAHAQSDDHAHHDHHGHHHHHVNLGPIGVMGTHLHEPGEWMVSYRYSTMHMEGSRDGDSDISTQEVLNQFMVAPTEMIMEMHMFGAMYGVTEDFTVMAMAPYVLKSMDHVTRMGGAFETETRGLGDIKLSAVHRLHQHDQYDLLGVFGISLPTGSIDEMDQTPMGFMRLPYPMQLGSGTFDLMPALTHTAVHGDFNWGTQAAATIRLGKNNNGYRLGNEYKVNVWTGYDFSEMLGGSLRLEGASLGDINGEDRLLNPAVVQTANPNNIGGERIDAFIGVEFQMPDAPHSRVALEFGLPLYQNLNGPQLETDWRLMLGGQVTF